MENFDEVLVRQNRFTNSLVFSDGIGSSGKRMLGHIVASFKGIEKMSHHFVFDYVAELYWLGKISEDAACAYLQTEADLQTYQLMLSRDQNFRPGDTTSVFSNPNPWRYLRRLFLKEGEAVAERIRQTNPWLHEAPHDGLRKASLYFSAFGDRLRLVHIVRNPIDLVADLIRRGFDWRVGVDPREFQLTLIRGRTPIPIALRDLNLDFAALTDADLVALTVHESMKHNLLGHFDLNGSDRDCVKLVFFDDFCDDPEKQVSELTEFLGVTRTVRTRRAITRERLPRRLSDRASTVKSLQGSMTATGLDAVERSLEMYFEFRRRAA